MSPISILYLFSIYYKFYVIYFILKINISGKKSDNKMNEEFNEAIIAALRDNKKPDGVDGFLLLLGERLRKLPYTERTKLEMKFLNMLIEEQEKLHKLS